MTDSKAAVTKIIFVSVFLLALSGLTLAQDVVNLEQQLLSQLNQSRREAGLQALSVEPKLTEAARAHSQLMALQRKLAHVLPGEADVADRLAATGLHYSRSGENVGFNSYFSGLHSAFMKSPPHRENILNPSYTQVGIGLVRDDEGVYWATEDFAQTIVQRTSEQAEESILHVVASIRQKADQQPLQRVDDIKVRDLACSMSTSGKMDPRQVLSQPGVHQAVTYNNIRPDDLPPSARQAAIDPANTKFAVGACFASDGRNPGGTYFVVMAFY